MMVYIEEENFKLKPFFFINHICLTCNILWVDKSKKQTTRLKFFLFLFSLSFRNIFSPSSFSPPPTSFLFKFLHTLFLLPASSPISWNFLSSCYYFLNFFLFFLSPFSTFLFALLFSISALQFPSFLNLSLFFSSSFTFHCFLPSVSFYFILLSFRFFFFSLFFQPHYLLFYFLHFSYSSILCFQFFLSFLSFFIQF